MKLYTEEQVKQAMIKALYDDDMVIGFAGDVDIINSLTPIELPTEQEIEKEANDFMFEVNKAIFYNGAKWVIQHIASQINKQP